MKKLFKIAGIALLSLIGLLLAIFLLARFVFREQVKIFPPPSATLNRPLTI